MELQIKKATESDAQEIHDIQVAAFRPLLEKYRDEKTNPANESVDRVITRIHNPNGAFYKIYVEDSLVGAICVYWKEHTQYWISPLFISPEHQGKGIAQKAISTIEKMFPNAVTWELSTILEEKGLCHLYEKLGYKQTGIIKKLNDETTLVFYKKFNEMLS